MSTRSSTSRVGVVLAGGAARGAYEVGVLRHVVDDVARSLGREVPLDVLCGTSAGSINACALAALADQPRARAERLSERWSSLTLEEVIRPAAAEILYVAARLLGRTARSRGREGRRGGIFDPRGVEGIVRMHIPFERIGEHLRAGLVHALSISTTHVASGRTVVFVQRGRQDPLSWGGDPTMIAREVEIRTEHVLASAAVPLLFPAVEIDGQFYCDGGLRQNVPLSPARRLGADSLLVISPRFIRENAPPPSVGASREREYPDPLLIVGKAMNALLLDRIENDIDRLQRLNAVLSAGARCYGPGFSQTLNEELHRNGKRALRPLGVAYVRASQDIGILAADYVRSPDFTKKHRSLIRRALRRVAEGETEADLLSYVLFDGEFCGRLMEIGRADARTKHSELVSFFENRLEGG